MTDFIRTVTIPLAEYDQLRRDAAPVQNRIADARNLVLDAYNEYMRHYRDSLSRTREEQERDRLGNYLRYMQRCMLLNRVPVAYGDWQVWAKVSDAPEAT